ncbi:MAG: phosphoglucosamine mutase, partial [Dehalococcoidia bacterium]|nr:phosphoglucosamine mutase [Dehalococcoidia bacterium]
MELFGSSGFRAIVDRDFMDIAFRFGFAIGSTARSALVATDTRTSADAVKFCVISGLLASGCKAFDGGIMPTPTLALNCRDFDAGVMITASHNPPQYNGIKPWNPDGSAFDTLQRHRIERLVSRST